MPRSARSWSRASAGPEGERDELRAQKQALEEQKRALEGEKEELLRSVQRSQSELAALRTQLGEREQTARQTQQALEESRREAEALREQVAGWSRTRLPTPR